ncbi:MAG: GDP-mannose 4,6-dehydratase [Sphingomonas sp.]|uniref:dTDP-glucose 4,6-dehydratase n=1 Tax=Sphingomonas sp. TaxID=28214 RepID=UPI0035A8F24C|nr:GDP-mannose 4,6-dehydratase [Sphingomonas sp.]
MTAKTRAPIEISYTPPERTILVTGGAGFIGSAVCRLLASNGSIRVINLDSLVDSVAPEALAVPADQPNYRFVEGDILDRALLAAVMAQEQVDGVIHIAAEGRADRPGVDIPPFIDTNVGGTFQLLEASLAHWRTLMPDARARFRFHHVSTNAVFGDLAADARRIDETAPYRPGAPCAATRAAADHLVRAWHSSFGLPVVISHGGNCYGPYQKPGKLIPHAILAAIGGVSVPVYGSGSELRDWLHVEDYARALTAVLIHGQVGQHYMIGGREERSSLAVVAMICDLLDRLDPRADGRKRRSLISFLPDRRATDRRHAIDPGKIERELGWRPEIGLVDGLTEAIDWHRDQARVARRQAATG